MHNPAVRWMEEQVLHKRSRPCLSWTLFPSRCMSFHIYARCMLRHTLILRHRSLAARRLLYMKSRKRGTESLCCGKEAAATPKCSGQGREPAKKGCFFATAHFHNAAPLVNRIPAFLYSFRPTEWHALCFLPLGNLRFIWKYILWAPALQVPPPALRRHVPRFSAAKSLLK